MESPVAGHGGEGGSGRGGDLVVPAHTQAGHRPVQQQVLQVRLPVGHLLDGEEALRSGGDRTDLGLLPRHGGAAVGLYDHWGLAAISLYHCLSLSITAVVTVTAQDRLRGLNQRPELQQQQPAARRAGRTRAAGESWGSRRAGGEQEVSRGEQGAGEGGK